MFVWLSRVGSQGIVWVAIAAALAALWRRPSVLALVITADVGANLLSYALKQAIGRRRPPIGDHVHALVRVPRDGSFPSGHAATSFACAALLAWYAPRAAPAFFLLAAAIAASRVYVGVHYPLDVVGGAVFGLVVARALRMLLRGRRRGPPAPTAG